MPAVNTETTLLTLREAARLLHVSPRGLMERVRAGELAAWRLKGTNMIRLDRRAVAALLNQMGEKVQ